VKQRARAQELAERGLYTLAMSRGELAAIAIGITLLSLGCVSTGAAALRLRRSSMTLVTFGLWCSMYGARLLAGQPAIRATVGGTLTQWRTFGAIVTYTINVPITIFIASLIGAGWRRSTWWLAAGVSAFAVIGIASDLMSGRPASLGAVNSWVVLTALTGGLVNIVYLTVGRGMRTPLTDPIVMIGGLVLVLFVVNENLGEIAVRGVNVEPIGVLVFILCLGYAVARSVFRAEAEFVSVQRELEIARGIQLSLLPGRIPKPSGLDVAVRYVPAAAVAGDIYDFVEIGPACVGILVADVMGHGIPAALVASMAKLAFSLQIGRARDPAAVLTSMNEILCGHLKGSYVTAVYAVVETDARRVTLANAGHPPPLVQRHGESGGHVEREHGLMLGVLPTAEYVNAHVDRFAAGDRLLLYSDGVLEARNRAGEFFDGERVSRWLSSFETTTADLFADAALDELTRWRHGSHFEDDVTFVVAEGKT
jgi:sigma-B regulation protein RsbU (phosphoserine phosphatase)